MKANISQVRDILSRQAERRNSLKLAAQWQALLQRTEDRRQMSRLVMNLTLYNLKEVFHYYVELQEHKRRLNLTPHEWKEMLKDAIVLRNMHGKGRKK